VVTVEAEVDDLLMASRHALLVMSAQR